MLPGVCTLTWLGTPPGVIAPGARADLLLLDTDDAAIAEHPAESVLDAAIFGPARRPVRDVMSAGRWVVRDGRHAREDEVLARYRRVLAGIALNGRA